MHVKSYELRVTSYELPHLSACNAQAGGGEQTPEVKGTWFPDAFGNAMAHFIEALEADKPFHCDARDNLKSVAMIEATYISAAENRVVFPDELI
jgi:predicted dehydrogenase